MEMDSDFIALTQVDDDDFKDLKKRAVLKRKVLKFLTKYGRLAWSIEIELMIFCFENYLATEYTNYYDI